MSDTLSNCNLNSSETRHIFSSNFTFDRIIKQKIFEIEKLGQLSSKTVKKRQNNDVIMKKYLIENLIILFFLMAVPKIMMDSNDGKQKEKKKVFSKNKFKLSK
jgi:hypothetical protein